MNNNELFADASPMVEGSVEPTHDAPPASTSGAGSQSSPFQNQGGFDDFTAPQQGGFVASPNATQQQGFAANDDFGNDFVAAPAPASTGYGSGNQSQTSTKNDFGFAGEQQGSTGSHNFAAAPAPAAPPVQQSSPIANDDGFFGAPAPSTSSPTATQVVSSPSAPAAVVAPAQPVISPNGSQRNLAVTTPTRSQNGSSSTPVAPSQAFLEAGKARLDAQRRAVQERTAANDAATRKKEQDILAKAAAFLAESEKKRSTFIATSKADHLREQQQYEAKMTQFKKSGAVWNSVNLLVDVNKPNPYSKNTEYMRKLFGELQQQQQA